MNVRTDGGRWTEGADLQGRKEDAGRRTNLNEQGRWTEDAGGRTLTNLNVRTDAGRRTLNYKDGRRMLDGGQT